MLNFSKIGLLRSIRSIQSTRFLVQPSRVVLRNVPYFPAFRSFSSSSYYINDFSTSTKANAFVEDVSSSTEDQHIIQLSQYVKENKLEESLVEYSKIPLFLPRSDFRIVCSLMQQLGERCGIPDLDNVFTKIQKMKLSRKHALTFRCLIQSACELKNAELIRVFYASVCSEEVYVNNSFLNDITIDCLFSIEAYSTICSIFDSMQVSVEVSSLFSFLLIVAPFYLPSITTPVKTPFLHSLQKDVMTC